MSPVAWAHPRFNARPNENSSGAMRTISAPWVRAIATESSVDPESTRITWSGRRAWRSSPVNSAGRCSASLSARMTIDTVGMAR